jgi:SAM-dependent methyltransferase
MARAVWHRVAIAELMTCGVCGSRALRDHAGRRLAYCTECGALERHRALISQFAATLENGDGRRALEVGPVSATCFKGYLEARGWDAVSIDRWRTGNPHDPRDVRFVDVEIDVTDMWRFSDDSFDLVIAQHVIEEIEDFRRALDEISRVLRPGGLALLEIPFDRHRAASVAQSPNHFGNVWLFGVDLLDELHSRFGVVEARELHERDYRGEVLACRAA